jgi:hypothetical protein
MPPTMNIPRPTPIYRIVHLDNLQTLLERGGLHAPNRQPNDGRPYRVIHNADIQEARRIRPISCGPRGVIHDYVSFYFGPRSPMLFQLHTGYVAGYTERQNPIIYLVSSVEKVQQSGTAFVFSDGHGIATFTDWFDSVFDLDKFDWAAVSARIWRDTIEDMDRQRRKQAEFLVHEFCSWDLVERVGVLDQAMKARVEAILEAAPRQMQRPVDVVPDWYY